jgi:hypothetical protein
MNPTHAVSHEKIAMRAHRIWEEAGRPHGCETEHWLQAERELQAQGDGKAKLDGSHRGSVEPMPAAKHSAPKAPHSSDYVHPGVTTDSLHHRRQG